MYFYTLATHQISYSYLQGLVKGNEKFCLVPTLFFFKSITLKTAAHCINVSSQSIIIYSFLTKTLCYKQYTT